MLALILVAAAMASADDSFKPAEAVSVTDAFSILFYPETQIRPDAFVILNLCLNREGNIRTIDVLRDPVSMGKIATSSARSWKFRPASEQGQAVASPIPVVFVYRPTNFGFLGPPSGLQPTNLKPALPDQPCATKGTNYVPAAALAATYPDYPVNSVAWGSVIIQVTINAGGRMAIAKVLHPMPSFTQFSLDALKKWRFQAATLGGKPMDSNLVIAFVFQTPSSTPY